MMRRMLLAIAVAALVLAISLSAITAAVETLYGARVQRVTPYPEPLRELTGELGAMEGEPVDALVFPSTPVLERAGDVIFVDRTAVYPIQIRSLRLMGHGAAGALGLCSLLLTLARRFVRSPDPSGARP